MPGVILNQRLSSPGERIEEEDRAFFNRAQIHPLGHQFQSFYLGTLRDLAGVTDTVAHILVIGVKRCSRHHVVELAKQDLPPSLGILLRLIRPAGAEISYKRNGLGFS